VGDIDLMIPKLRTGSYLPSILEPRRRVDQALYGVVMEAYVGGISTRKVDALVAALGVQSGISRSQVSRICAEIDVQVQAFLNRPLEEGGYAYVYLDATYLHGRLGKALQVCSRAVVVAMGVNADGRRELLGLKVGDSESEGFWSEFLVSLKQRGLSGVKLVISDAHVGLTKSIRRQLQGCAWRRTARCAALSSPVPGALCPQPAAAGALAARLLRSSGLIRAWSRLRCAVCLPRRALRRLSRAGMTWLPRWLSAFPKPPSSCWRPRRTCWPSATSRSPTGARSGAPTCWSA